MDDDPDVPLSQVAAQQLIDSEMEEDSDAENPQQPLPTDQPRRIFKSKQFNDPINNHMRMDKVAMQFIDTEPFQRLRELHQLGLSYYVFPGATHRRFEHSLGVCHKAWECAERIWRGQRRTEARSRQRSSSVLVDMDQRDILVVALAGLCHDLGHGPFSHVFDKEFLTRKNITDWEHEEMSCKLVDYIRDTAYIDEDTLTKQESQLVKDLIVGDASKARPEKRFLFDIVANKRNGIDVDKADYLERDAQFCNVKISCDFQRLMRFSQVIDGEICYKKSEYNNIVELFTSRASMHRRVYTHKKAKAIEFMVVDALIEADEVLGLSANLYDPAEFIRFDDTLLRTIEHYHKMHRGAVLDGADKPLRDAQAIIQRLRRRDLYMFVNEVAVPDYVVSNGYQPPSAEDLCSYFPGDGITHLDPKLVIIQLNEINFGMKHKNPLDHVSFFETFDCQEKEPLNARDMGGMRVQVFQDCVLRVYYRRNDERVRIALSEALSAYIKEHFGDQAPKPMATPAKGRRKSNPLSCGGAAGLSHSGNFGACMPANSAGSGPLDRSRRASLSNGGASKAVESKEQLPEGTSTSGAPAARLTAEQLRQANRAVLQGGALEPLPSLPSVSTLEELPVASTPAAGNAQKSACGLLGNGRALEFDPPGQPGDEAVADTDGGVELAGVGASAARPGKRRRSLVQAFGNQPLLPLQGQ
ncbi:hypothetical protein V8C86DRAFT_2525688 [Haematococcus lacustris]